MTAHPRDRHTWRPDDGTIGWLMSNIDEPAIGRAMIHQLSVKAPVVGDVDPAVLGEAAVECVLFMALRMVEAAQKVPPGTPI